jgi:hypothetical protein
MSNDEKPNPATVTVQIPPPEQGAFYDKLITKGRTAADLLDLQVTMIAPLKPETGDGELDKVTGAVVNSFAESLKTSASTLRDLCRHVRHLHALRVASARKHNNAVRTAKSYMKQVAYYNYGVYMELIEERDATEAELRAQIAELQAQLAAPPVYSDPETPAPTDRPVLSTAV